MDADCLDPPSTGSPSAGTASGEADLRVAVLRTYAFTEPSIKSLPQGLYSLNALITPHAREGRFVKARDGGWFIAEHLAPLDRFETDPVAVAERFIGTPYLWGGNESLGLDCSGLVQQVLRACGLACPRDSDQQMALGTPIDPEAGLMRGDLVFWRGHVGFRADSKALLHAKGHHMAVVVEPLDEAIRRIEARSVLTARPRPPAWAGIAPPAQCHSEPGSYSRKIPGPASAGWRPGYGCGRS